VERTQALLGSSFRPVRIRLMGNSNDNRDVAVHRLPWRREDLLGRERKEPETSEQRVSRI